MSEKGRLARALFEQGYNCCQSVVGAFAAEMGMELEEAVRLASAFGGGLGRLREGCGAVSGMALVAGMLYGYASPTDGENKARTYGMMQELARRFRERNGSLLCRDLLGPEGTSTDPVPEARTADYYQRRPCPGLIACAADLLAELPTWDLSKEL